MQPQPRRPVVPTRHLLVTVAAGAVAVLAGAVAVAVLRNGTPQAAPLVGSARPSVVTPVERTVRLEATGPAGMQVNWSVGSKGNTITDAPARWSLDVTTGLGAWVTVSVLAEPEDEVSCRIVVGRETPEPRRGTWTAICSATIG